MISPQTQLTAGEADKHTRAWEEEVSMDVLSTALPCVGFLLGVLRYSVDLRLSGCLGEVSSLLLSTQVGPQKVVSREVDSRR